MQHHHNDQNPLNDSLQVTMTWCVCAGCNRTFTNLRYLTDHLEADSNYGCYKAVYGGASTSQMPRDDQANDTRASKRRKAIQMAEDVLRRMKKQDPHHSVTCDQDMSVFDFHNGDTEDEGNCLREEAELGLNEVPKAPPKPTDPLKITRSEVKEGEGTSKSLRNFKEYSAHSRQHNASLEPHMVAAAQLMSLMNKKGGSIALYEAVMDWHLANINKKQKKVSCDQLHKALIKRYNMEKVMPYEVETELPSTKEKVPLVCFDCEEQTADLLTDPRLCKEHYLFPNNHPAGNPPRGI